MSRPPAPRPPAPGQQPDGPSPHGKRSGGPDKQRKRQKLYPLRAVIAIAVIAVLSFIYTGVRHARVTPDTVPGPQGEQAELQRRTFDAPMNVTVTLPDFWKYAEQRRPAAAAARWAAGPPGAKRHAWFLTRYELARPAEDDTQIEQVRREAELSLQSSGAPGKLNPSDDADDIDGMNTWTYRYVIASTRYDVTFAADGRTLLQISCQSPDGEHGDAMREACAAAAENLKLRD
jgi:hypothetical protein